MLICLTLDDEPGKTRKVTRQLSFDIQHLLGSYSEYGDAANVLNSNTRNISSELTAVSSVRVELYSSKSGGYHSGLGKATSSEQKMSEARKSQEFYFESFREDAVPLPIRGGRCGCAAAPPVVPGVFLTMQA